MTNYTQSLIKGNNTLTKKVESLEKEIANKENIITSLKAENKILKREAEMHIARMKEYDNLLQENPIRKLTSTTNLCEMMDILKGL